jgi:alpha-beta hydrolase superfamily lysophospholipase
MDTRRQVEAGAANTFGSGGSSKPAIVLVHGAVEDSSLWTHGAIQALQRDGYELVNLAPAGSGHPQEEFRFEADPARSQVIELKSSHAIPITFPEVVVDVIKQAAGATAS